MIRAPLGARGLLFDVIARSCLPVAPMPTCTPASSSPMPTCARVIMCRHAPFVPRCCCPTFPARHRAGGSCPGVNTSHSEPCWGKKWCMGHGKTASWPQIGSRACLWHGLRHNSCLALCYELIGAAFPVLWGNRYVQQDKGQGGRARG